MTPQDTRKKIDEVTQPYKMTQQEALDYIHYALKLEPSKLPFLMELQSLIEGAIEGLRDDIENAGEAE